MEPNKDGILFHDRFCWSIHLGILRHDIHLHSFSSDSSMSPYSSLAPGSLHQNVPGSTYSEHLLSPLQSSENYGKKPDSSHVKFKRLNKVNFPGSAAKRDYG